MTRPSQSAEHKTRLAATEKERIACIAQVRDYLARTGLNVPDFARRIRYSQQAIYFFLADTYHHVGGDDSHIRKAICEYIEAHPIAAPCEVNGELYETANVRTIRETFQALLPRPVAYMIYAPPGSQKTFVLENEVARLNRDEIGKNGHGRRAYYFYARQNLQPLDLMKRVAKACGVDGGGQSIDRILANLAHDFSRRRVLLVGDEAQHLSIECFEILRELLDRPPHFSLLFAGSHDLKDKFDKFSATLEQWNSRLVAKVRLPGLEEDEARAIVQREVGDVLAKMTPAAAERKVRALIADAVTRDAFEKNRTYINVRTLTNSLYQIRAAVDTKEATA